MRMNRVEAHSQQCAIHYSHPVFHYNNNNNNNDDGYGDDDDPCVVNDVVWMSFFFSPPAFTERDDLLNDLDGFPVSFFLSPCMLLWVCYMVG